jgi:hypothetical protein
MTELRRVGANLYRTHRAWLRFLSFRHTTAVLHWNRSSTDRRPVCAG